MEQKWQPPIFKKVNKTDQHPPHQAITNLKKGRESWWVNCQEDCFDLKLRLRSNESEANVMHNRQTRDMVSVTLTTSILFGIK